MEFSDVPINLLNIKPDNSGKGLGFTVEVNEEFEQWFIKANNLNEWDEDKFQVWFKKFLADAAKDRVYNQFPARRSEQQNVDVWDTNQGGKNE